jgi:hypothetical protein
MAIFIALMLFVLLGVVANCTGNSKPPSVVDAPWAIQTSSLVYYGQEYSHINGNPALRGYWWYNGKKYIYNKGIKEFPYDLYGKINVVERVKK